jgi:phytoene synthase
VRARDALARACELGIAMQLTNIARDVGQDARDGRVYLPETWLGEEERTEEDVRRARVFDPAIARVVQRVLARADELYRSADAGIAALPGDCRGAIRAAAWIYAAIGTRIRARGCDTITARAHTSWWRKLVLIWKARRVDTGLDLDALARPVLPEAEELVAACGCP